MTAWSQDDDAELRRRYPHEKTDTVARALGRSLSSTYQRAYGLGLTKSAEFLASPAACRLRRGDNVGAAFRFPKGNVPANKGLRRPGWSSGRMRETQFKKGEMSGAAQHNYVPVGSHRLSKEGYLERKVTDDPSIYPARRWVGVHRLVWEAANGKVPPGHAVAFLPGRRSADPSLITLDALELVSRSELMRRNTIHNLPAPLPQLMQLRGALNRKLNRLEHSNEKQD